MMRCAITTAAPSVDRSTARATAFFTAADYSAAGGGRKNPTPSSPSTQSNHASAFSASSTLNCDSPGRGIFWPRSPRPAPPFKKLHSVAPGRAATVQTNCKIFGRSGRYECHPWNPRSPITLTMSCCAQPSLRPAAADHRSARHGRADRGGALARHSPARTTGALCRGGVGRQALMLTRFAHAPGDRSTISSLASQGCRARRQRRRDAVDFRQH